MTSLRINSALPSDVERTVSRVIGCGIEVHRRLGPGFVERVYHDALEIEFEANGVACEREVRVDIEYRGRRVHGHRLDLIAENSVVVEVKAVAAIEPVHVAQLISCLKASRLRVGLLMNFHAWSFRAGLRRIVV